MNCGRKRPFQSAKLAKKARMAKSNACKNSAKGLFALFLKKTREKFGQFKKTL